MGAGVLLRPLAGTMTADTMAVQMEIGRSAYPELFLSEGFAGGMVVAITIVMIETGK